MTVVREVMNPNTACVSSDGTAADAARQMQHHGIGALPISGPDNKIKGMVTDRDLVVKVLGPGRDAGTFPAGDLNQQAAATVGADDTLENALATMKRYQVRRLPVIDQERLVGMIAIGDLAEALPQSTIGDLVAVLSHDRDAREG